MMKELKIFGVSLTIILGLFWAVVAEAAPSTTYVRTLLPETDSTYDVGSNLVRFANGYFDNLFSGTLTIDEVVLGNMNVNGCGLFGTTSTTTICGDSSNSTFLGTGRVGVGTSTPWGKFSVGAHNLSLATPLFVIASSSDAVATSTRFIVTGAGNVGIGTTNPSSLLSVGTAGASTVTIYGVNSTSGGSAIRGDGTGGGTSYGGYFTHSGSSAGSGTALFAINSDGTATTAYGLQAQSNGNNTTNYAILASAIGASATNNYGISAAATGVTSGTNIGGYFTASGGTNNYAIITGTGNVGIGTTTPIANFQATNSSANASTSIQFGKPNQNKGVCLTLYDAAGGPVYLYVAAGASTLTIQNGGTAPSGCQN